MDWKSCWGEGSRAGAARFGVERWRKGVARERWVSACYGVTWANAGFGGWGRVPKWVGGGTSVLKAGEKLLRRERWKESSACCGVNLGAHRFFGVGAGVGSKMGGGRYFRVGCWREVVAAGGVEGVFCLLWGEPGRTQVFWGWSRSGFQNGARVVPSGKNGDLINKSGCMV